MDQKTNEITGRKKEREEVLQMLKRDPVVYARFLELTEDFQEDLIAFCMGNKGLKITWDPVFKEIFNPEVHADRLSELLSAILRHTVEVRRGLPNESSRLTAEGSLLIMDILVELESGGLANVEMQRIGYRFPGERGACYSSDLVLRQYARAKAEMKKNFTYREMKKVYTIVLMDESGREFGEKKEYYRHHARQVFDTGLNLELLQEYIYIPFDKFLDIYHKNNQNISEELEAWLLFLASDDPADIVRLTKAYPKFRELYAEIAAFQQRPEELVNMYSKALEIMDRNTVQYMIEEQKKEIEEQARLLAEKDKVIAEKDKAMAEKEKAMAEHNKAMAEKDAQLAALREKLENMNREKGDAL